MSINKASIETTTVKLIQVIGLFIIGFGLGFAFYYNFVVGLGFLLFISGFLLLAKELKRIFEQIESKSSISTKRFGLACDNQDELKTKLDKQICANYESSLVYKVIPELQAWQDIDPRMQDVVMNFITCDCDNDEDTGKAAKAAADLLYVLSERGDF
jgi:hypothetical protein